MYTHVRRGSGRAVCKGVSLTLRSQCRILVLSSVHAASAHGGGAVPARSHALAHDALSLHPGSRRSRDTRGGRGPRPAGRLALGRWKRHAPLGGDATAAAVRPIVRPSGGAPELRAYGRGQRARRVYGLARNGVCSLRAPCFARRPSRRRPQRRVCRLAGACAGVASRALSPTTSRLTW